MKENPTTRQRAAYKKMIVRELKRFFDIPSVSVKEFCFRVNAWRMKHGIIPVEGTPFRHRGKVVTWKEDHWSGGVRIKEEARL